MCEILELPGSGSELVETSHVRLRSTAPDTHRNGFLVESVEENIQAGESKASGLIPQAQMGHVAQLPNVAPHP